MIKILANDGIDTKGKQMLETAGFQISTEHIPQPELVSQISGFDVILVRSATKITREIIDAGNLKAIGRAGVGVDNIDVAHAKERGIPVYNTPSASSISVAELVFAHLFGLCRKIQITNRVMPMEGDSRFKELKNLASTGIELKGKTLGIIGIGRIGQEVAKIAIGCGMKVLGYDPFVNKVALNVTFHPDLDLPEITIKLKTISKEEVLRDSDFVTLHIPGGSEPVIGLKEFSIMKAGAGLINCARGGVIDEKALLEAIENGHIAFAGLDVFEKEPPVYLDILKHDHVSLSPHIGASTKEAQERIGIELASKIIDHFQ
jgi:D-3-phosphoglycerate dehydrogenase